MVMKRITAVLCVLSIILPAFAYLTEVSAKASVESPSVAVVDASVEDDDAGSVSNIWDSAIIKLRSSWLSLLILVLVLIALAVVVPYRRSLGVDHKEFE